MRKKQLFGTLKDKIRTLQGENKILKRWITFRLPEKSNVILSSLSSVETSEP